MRVLVAFVGRRVSVSRACCSVGFVDGGSLVCRVLCDNGAILSCAKGMRKPGDVLEADEPAAALGMRKESLEILAVSLGSGVCKPDFYDITNEASFCRLVGCGKVFH